MQNFEKRNLQLWMQKVRQNDLKFSENQFFVFEMLILVNILPVSRCRTIPGGNSLGSKTTFSPTSNFKKSVFFSKSFSPETI